MSLWRDRDECAVCGGLVGYAGHRARQSELRAHLACKCDEQLTECLGDPLLKAREDAERDAREERRRAAA